MKIFLNNQYLDAQDAKISIWDAGFLFGEGIFTTFRLYNGIPADLKTHWLRLKEQTAELCIDLPLGFEQTKIVLQELVELNNLQNSDARARITITRGGDETHPVPVAPQTTLQPTALCAVHAISAEKDDEISQGLNAITLGAEFVRGNSPHLKTMNHLAAVLGLRQARAQGCSEAIILDSTNRITEGAMSNMFLVNSSGLCTPKNDGRILNGCTRKMVLSLAGKNGMTCLEKDLHQNDLMNADEVFLCNSVRQIMPIIQIDSQSIGQGKPGPVTQTISQLYSQNIKQLISGY